MGEDAQCCKWVTHVFPPAEAGTISPKSGESSTTGQKWPQVLGDDTETTIGPLGSAQATLMYIRTGLISSLQRNIMWFKLSVKVLFWVPQRHTYLSHAFSVLCRFWLTSNLSMPCILETLVSDKSLVSPCEWQVQARTAGENMTPFFG